MPPDPVASSNVIVLDCVLLSGMLASASPDAAKFPLEFVALAIPVHSTLAWYSEGFFYYTLIHFGIGNVNVTVILNLYAGFPLFPGSAR